MLDLNLPRKDGREVLAEIKSDDDLKTIPVVVLTTSRAEQDVLQAYKHHANCYITKPVDFEQFLSVVRSIESFWLMLGDPAAGGQDRSGRLERLRRAGQRKGFPSVLAGRALTPCAPRRSGD